jgi:predicted membrane channel-forming protein YqfA (hemolysin III family)
MQMTLLKKTVIVWSVVISMFAITASVPSLTERYMNNITTDGLTLLYVSGIVFVVSIVAYLVRNYSKRLVKNEPRQ